MAHVLRAQPRHQSVGLVMARLIARTGGAQVVESSQAAMRAVSLWNDHVRVRVRVRVRVSACVRVRLCVRAC